MNFLLSLILAFAPFSLYLAQMLPGPGGNVTSAGGTISVLQHRCDAGSANSATTMAVDTTGASTIVVIATLYEDTDPPVITSSPSAGSFTARVASTAGTNYNTYMFSISSPTTDASQTFTSTSTGSYQTICVIALAGTAASPYDQSSSAYDGNMAGTSLQPGSVTPSQDNEIVITGLAFGDSTGQAIGSGFSTPDVVPFAGGNNIGGAMAYKIQTSAAAVNPTWSWTSSVFSSTVIATFKP